MSENNDKGVNKNVINWYPGHMVKAQKEIQDNLKLIDVVVEVLDARIPLSSRNPKIDEIIESKPRIIVLNKSDMADMIQTKNWKKYFEVKGYTCIILDTINNKGIKELSNAIIEVGKASLTDKQKRLGNRAIRCLIVGIPNVGKSSIINKIAKKQSAEVGNRPGVTRRKQWIRLNEGIELLDTPGILWPDLSSNDSGFNLAVTGNIKQEILEVENIAFELIVKLKEEYFNNLMERYKLDESDCNLENIELFEKIGEKRGCIKNKEVDYERLSNLIINEFKNGTIGKITLEKCDI